MAYIDLKSGRVYYQMMASGGGGTLIFIHGAGGNSQKWSKIMEDGMAGWNLVAIDLPGHGESTGQPLERIADYAGVVKEFAETVSLPRPVILVGQSMGGSISLQAALSYPQLVDGLVLLGSGARMPCNQQMLEQLAQGTFDTGFLRISYGPDAPAELLESELKEINKVPQQYLYTDFNACNNYDVTEQLGSLALPVLILVGDKDKMTPVRISQFMEQNIPGSVLRIIPGAGHVLMLEKPLETKRSIQDFLGEKFA